MNARLRLLLPSASVVAWWLAGTVTAAAQEASEAKIEPPPAARPAAKAPAAKINLNTATAEELQTLPAVGQYYADLIIKERPYRSIDELERKGIPASVIVGFRNRVTVGASNTPGPTSRLDLNTATQAELEALPGVSRELARAIMAGRPYRSVDELRRVVGLGAYRLADLRPRVKVDTAAAPAPSASSGAGAGLKTKTKTAATTNGEAATAHANANDSSRKTRPGTMLADRGGSEERAASKPAPGGNAGTIDLNTATQAELETLPGIGPAKARAIIEGRPYAKIEDVMRVPGIKEGTFAKIKNRISVQY